MDQSIEIEVVGLREQYCSPFPCDETRSCGLSECYPSGKMIDAFKALQSALKQKYGDRVTLRLTLIDDEVPPHVREILDARSPPLPIILVGGELMPFGRISLPQIEKAVGGCLS